MSCRTRWVFRMQKTQSVPDQDDQDHISPNLSKKLKLGLVHPGPYVEWILRQTEAEHARLPEWELVLPKEEVDTMTEQGSEEEHSVFEDDMFAQMRKELAEEHRLKELLKEKAKQFHEEWLRTPWTLISLEGERGDAELIRLLFVLANVHFEDRRILPEEWDEIKIDTPYQALPVLSKCGKMWGETAAIVRMLARTFNLMGVTNDEQLVVEATYERLRRLQNTHSKAIGWLTDMQKNKERLEWAQSQMLHVILPPALKEWENLITKTKGPYIVECGMTMADIAIVDFLDVCGSRMYIEPLLEENIAVLDLIMLVKKNSSIAVYLEDRKED